MPTGSTRQRQWRARRHDPAAVAWTDDRACGCDLAPRRRGVLLSPPRPQRQLRAAGCGDPVRRCRRHADPCLGPARLSSKPGRSRRLELEAAVTGFIALATIAVLAGLVLPVTAIRH